eukprot:TRINITY_DN33906_c0_g1_i1.p1 TRINITY_DN33906_c0_g1~~TRINITY_DN33906_c0_g1_i1.p1  ORF type:complete len:264 (+),score=40.09 TRINITY_DN33906_c0_g1_i1:157-948(+)
MPRNAPGARRPSKSGSKKESGDLNDERRGLFKGTRLCYFYLAGACTRGANCTFAHSSQELKQQPDFTKTRLCESYQMSGGCQYGDDCKFAHGMDELRQPRQPLDSSVTSLPVDEPSFCDMPPVQPLTMSAPASSSAATPGLQSPQKHALHVINALPFTPGIQPRCHSSGYRNDLPHDWSRQTTDAGQDSNAESRWNRQDTDDTQLERHSESSEDDEPYQGNLDMDIHGLNVSVRNTFLHFENDSSSASTSKRRARSHPAQLPS